MLINILYKCFYFMAQIFYSKFQSGRIIKNNMIEKGLEQ